jgi:hypothetical protein
MFEAKGMKTYHIILMSVRLSGGLVGTKYHLYDKHFKEWCKGKSFEETLTPAARIKLEKQKARAEKQSLKNRRGEDEMDGAIKRNLSKEEIQELVNRIEKETASSNVVLSGASKTVTSLDVAVRSTKTKGKVTATATAQEEKDKLLREKIRQMEQKKLAESLQCEDRLFNVKSVGNGL